MDKSNREIRIKLAEQNLVTFKARLRTAADKDSVRRQIAATERIIRDLRQEN